MPTIQGCLKYMNFNSQSNTKIQSSVINIGRDSNE